MFKFTSNKNIKIERLVEIICSDVSFDLKIPTSNSEKNKMLYAVHRNEEDGIYRGENVGILPVMVNI